MRKAKLFPVLCLYVIIKHMKRISQMEFTVESRCSSVVAMLVVLRAVTGIVSQSYEKIIELVLRAGYKVMYDLALGTEFCCFFFTHNCNKNELN